jgi:hypothetical protein
MIKLYVLASLISLQSFAATIIWEDQTFIKVGKSLYTKAESIAYANALKTYACYKKDSTLTVNFADGWKVFTAPNWNKEVQEIKVNKAKLAPIVTLLRLLEHKKKLKIKNYDSNPIIRKMVSRNCPF